MRSFWSAVTFLYEKLWKEPKDIRGVAWTTLFWARLLLGLSVCSIVCSRPGGFALVLGYSLVALAFNHVTQKPRKLGRPLPYRRRR